MPSTATPGPPEARARLHTQHGVPSHTSQHRPSRSHLPRTARPSGDATSKSAEASRPHGCAARS
eukprot:7291225-Lingulodinium_polyedra.AAC.1